jgi:nucleolar complex protein 3
VVDLLAVLKNLIKSVDDLPLDAVLNCILTSFQTLQGPGRELKIDQKEYIMPLYSHIPRLSSDENSVHHTDTMIRCLTYAFIKRREHSTTRIASFLKQICTTVMHAPVYAGIPLLVFARHLIQRYPSAEQMLENEQDVITSGEYKADVDDPELTNAFATSTWELATLKFHINKGVADQATAAATMRMLQLPGDDPEKIRSVLLEDYNALYIPFKRNSKKHPLATTTDSNAAADSKKKKTQVRFIKPRVFQSKFIDA